MISKAVVQEIIETARIEEVVSDFMVLKKRGVNLLGLCPFHDEKSPSFTVSAAKGIFKCFGCGKAGNAAGFIMEHEHCSFPEALRYLAAKYNITIEEDAYSPERAEEKNEKESLYIINEFASRFYSEYLFSAEEGRAEGLSYFEERGYKEKIINKFQLGFAPAHPKAFTQAAITHGYLPELLEKSGLSLQHNSAHFSGDNIKELYDRFRARVMFPIHNLAGRVCSFGARLITQDVKSPKYINSPESEIYHKSKILFGLHFAKKAILQHNECYLVEGYTDVLSLHQEEIENVVASSGTSLTADQIRMIGRYTKNITVLYDGDAAGIKASLRGIDLILEEGLNVKAVLFPEGEDPDSFVKKHSHSELVHFLKNNAQDFIKFKTSLLLKEVENDPAAKAALIKEIVATISKIPDVITRTIYVSKCAEQLEVDEQALLFELNKIIRNKFHSKYKVKFEELEPEFQQHITKKYDLKESLKQQEEELIRILLNYSDDDIILIREHELKTEMDKLKVRDFIAIELNNDSIYLEDITFNKMYQHFSYLVNENKAFDINFFLNLDDEEIRNIAINLTTSQYQLSNWAVKDILVPLEKDGLGNLVEREIYRFKLKKIIIMLNDNLKTIKEYNFNENRYYSLQDRHIALIKIRKQFAEYLGTVVLL